MFHLLCIFKELGVKLNYNPALYIGSNEETGMADIIGLPDNDDAKGFINVHKPPKLSLVPDGGFPVGYGGKGGMTITLKSKKPLHGWCMESGLPSSPGRAEAILPFSYAEPLPKCTVTAGEQTRVTAETPPRHGSNPDPNGNMITHLSTALLDAALIPEEDRYVLEFFKAVSTDANGKYFTVATNSDCMKPLTVFTQRVAMKEGFATILLNVRYPVGITFDEIVSRIGAVADANGFTVLATHRGVDPYLLDRNAPAVSLLREAANDVIGDDAQPFTVGGGTYAHRLPNAYVFGASGNLPPSDFSEGRGGAHGVDEAVSLDRLQRAMRIYARALLALNDFSF
jgi:succinyl-diaminopimelate desuccinylase